MEQEPAQYISDILGKQGSTMLRAYEKHAPMCVIEPDGSISYANAAFCTLYGYRSEQLIGQPHQVLRSDSDDQGMFEEMLTRVAEGEVWRGIVRHASSGGEQIWVDVTVIPFQLPEPSQAGFVSLCTDVTHLVDAQTSMEANATRLSLSQQYASIGTWDWNLETGELEGTDWLDSLFGYARGDFRKSFEDLLSAIHEDDRQQVDELLQACITGGAEFSVEHRVVWPDGTVRWLMQRGDVQRDASGKPLRMLSVVQDIHARKIAEDAANRSTDVKNKFLASVSHELRTPLNAVMGFSQILQADPEIGERQQELVDNIFRAGNHLLGIINEIIDYSKIEAGILDISNEQVSLPAVLDEVAEMLQQDIELKDIWLSYSREPSEVWGDRKRLLQILINFVSNAIKYNRKGGSVIVSWSQRPGHLANTRISVTDTGIGIGDSNLEQLFTPFDRLGRETSDIEGMGVGLTVARTLAKAMGGDVGVDSELGIGSTFWLDLPARRHDVIAAIDSEDESPTFSAGPILLFEADTRHSSLLASQLDHLRCDYTCVFDRIEALERVANGSYALVIAAYGQAGSRGTSMASEVHRIQPRLPVAVISDDDLSNTRPEIGPGSLARHITKPVSLNNLQTLISALLNFTPLAPLLGATIDEGEPFFDLEKVKNYVGYNPASYHKILSVLAAELPNGMQRLHEAQLNRDVEGILFELHKLKSSAAAVGSTPLLQTAEELAAMVRNGHWDISEQSLSRLQAIAARVLEEINGALTASIQDPVLEPLQGAPRYDLSEFRFLILDDDSFVLDTVSAQLELCQAREVERFLDCDAALEYLRICSATPEFLLCDIHMPGKDGIWMMRELERIGYAGQLILISGEDRKLLHIAADFASELALDVAGCLRKPFSLDEIAQLILSAGSEGQEIEPVVPRLEDFLYGDDAAFDENRVRLQFQPRVDFRHDSVVIAEVPISLEDPSGKLHASEQFMPMVEQAGRVDELNAIIFDKAAKRLARWLDRGANLKLAIDLSAQSLASPGLAEQLLSSCRAHGVAPQNFILEVSESSLMTDLAPVLETMGHLRILGFIISIADFGTGYATFKKLQRLPSSELKLSPDQIADAADSEESRSILASSVELARKLGIRTVANGVEDERALAIVRGLKCDMAQGDFMVPAMSTELFTIWLDSAAD